MVDQMRICNTLGKMDYYLSNHESICVGVSGGSDSNIIVHMIATHFREYLPKVHFVFSNTGIEYKATIRHLDWMENHYNITIERIRPAKGDNLVSVVRREGVPILSKTFSHTVPQAQRGYESAFRKINGELMYNGKPSSFNFTKKQKELAEYLIEHEIKVSDKCCDLSKKKPFHKFVKEVKADLIISGERKCEGGARATRHKNCFENQKDGIDKYMPLFFWDDDTKQWYKEHENITYSDCYEIWGMKRTGCVGCPFNSRVGEELKIIQKYEPNLYTLCMNVFGESYRLMDKFEVHRSKNKILKEVSDE